MRFERPPVPFAEKRQDKLASVFMSNCDAKNARGLILDELIRLLPGARIATASASSAWLTFHFLAGQIDSFGACANNADVVEELQKLGRWDELDDKSEWNIKVAATSVYKFS